MDQAQSVADGGGANASATTSLYVGDLDVNVTDSQLEDLFNKVGHVVSVRVCRDWASGRSLGYGYVNYSTLLDAGKALEVLNFTPLNDKPIRIMYSQRDPTARKSGAGNIFIKNLDRALDQKGLHEIFSAFGNILSCKVASDSSGQSKGYGFVQYDNEEAAKKAIEKLNGMLLFDKQVYVGPFLHKQERETAIDNSKFSNVFVKNLSESTSEEDLQKIFGEFGPTTSVVVMKDAEGKSKCFGFANFENPDDAARSVEALNGKKFDEKEWYVGKAQKKSERESELEHRLEQTVKEVSEMNQGSNLYIKNLDDLIDDDRLKELFAPYGTLTSCRVMRDPNGVSRGSGFVAFSTAEEANIALNEMRGKMVLSKPLYIAHAQRKEDRKASLQAQFSQIRPVVMPPAMAPRMPFYPPGGPGLGQLLFYGQGPPAVIPPQPGFGYWQQLVPGIRPGAAPMTNFLVPMVPQGQQPMVPQGQQGPQPGGRRGGVVQQGQQPVPMRRHQMLPRGRGYRYPPSRGGMPMRGGSMSPQVPISSLASALANASPDQQRTMLGVNLYPLVERLEPDAAAKVTGMLLEMDQPVVLRLLESPEALKAAVAQAIELLRRVAQSQVGSASDQLGSLSLNDSTVP